MMMITETGTANTMDLRFVLILVTVLAPLVGCSSQDRSTVVCLDEVDPDLQAASVEARKTVDDFLKRLQKPATPGNYRAVKARFQEGPIVEHLWIRDVQFDGKRFVGIVDSQPEKLVKVEVGQTHVVLPEEIADWMILEGNKLIGGYTIRALRKKVPSAMRADWEHDLGVTIEDSPKKDSSATLFHFHSSSDAVDNHKPDKR